MLEDLKMMKEDYIRELIRYYREHGLKNDSIEAIDTMAHTAKNLCKIYEACEEEQGGYSMGRDMSYGNYSMRGRGSNANRDSMGRYSGMGYSGDHDLVNELRGLMNRTTDEANRRDLQDMINRMEMR